MSFSIMVNGSRVVIASNSGVNPLACVDQRQEMPRSQLGVAGNRTEEGKKKERKRKEQQRVVTYIDSVDICV